MYFRSTPNIRSVIRPTKYPFAEGDFTIAKNFFRRFNIDDKVFSDLVFFKKYTIRDGDRLDLHAEYYYGDPFLDWVILLTNNMINGVYDWPLDYESLRNKVERENDDPYNTIHHYETKQVLAGYQVDGIDVVALEGGLIVDETFYNSTYKFFNGTQVQSVPGNTVSIPISIFANEEKLNEQRREIFILKKRYLTSFVDAFKSGSKYAKSSDFITNQLKKTSI